MKNKLILFTVISLSLFTITSCVDREVDPPTFEEYVASDTANGTVLTIAEFKALNSELQKGGVYQLDTNQEMFVRGVVIGNGVSGNIYKKMYIQDIGLDPADASLMTRGLEISIDKTSLFTFYPEGQVIYLRCKGFYMGNYDGYQQFGYIDENGGPGRIPTQLVDSAILIHGLPHYNNFREPLVKKVTEFTANDVNRLVKVENVSFKMAGNVYADEELDGLYPERTIIDGQGDSIVVITSTYANFAADTIPSGWGDVQGILTLYNGENRIIIRGTDDVMFD